MGLATKRTITTEFYKTEITEGLSKSEYEAYLNPTDSEVSSTLFELLPIWENRAITDLSKLGPSFARWASFATSNITPPGFWDAPPIARAAWAVIAKARACRMAMKTELHGADVFRLALAAIDLGLAVGCAHVTPFEPVAETGRRVRQAAALGNQAYTAEQKEYCLATRNYRRNEIPKPSDRTIASDLSKETGIRFETIRDWFKPPRRPRSR
ncbi:hypothetical protein [Plasticicumulans sp.]|uniref:hypothetical protein n=1 Tax=Plasticicumulans sp. TaxID=2307179 RepID=UPI0032203496